MDDTREEKIRMLIKKQTLKDSLNEKLCEAFGAERLDYILFAMVLSALFGFLVACMLMSKGI